MNAGAVVVALFAVLVVVTVVTGALNIGTGVVHLVEAIGRVAP